MKEILEIDSIDQIHHKWIWVLLDVYETDAIFAELDEPTLRRVAEKMFKELKDDDDPDAPKTVEEMMTMISDALRDNDIAEFSVYTLERRELLIMPHEQDFEVKKGVRILEGAERVTMGCDLAYARVPIVFYTSYPELPEYAHLEWIDRTIE